MSTMGAVSVWRPVGTAGQASERPGPAGGPIRLTRRGRTVSALVALVAVAWLAVLVVSHAAAGVPAAPSGGVGDVGSVVPVSAGMARVTVQDGDSLWAIAQRSAPDSDTREVVSQIRNVNGLSSSLIQPGQVLLVPAAR